eukprot:697613_1
MMDITFAILDTGTQYTCQAILGSLHASDFLSSLRPSRLKIDIVGIRVVRNGRVAHITRCFDRDRIRDGDLRETNATQILHSVEHRGNEFDVDHVEEFQQENDDREYQYCGRNGDA